MITRSMHRRLRAISPDDATTHGLKVVGWHRPIRLPGHPEPDPEPIFEGTDPPIIPIRDPRYSHGDDTDGDPEGHA